MGAYDPLQRPESHPLVTGIFNRVLIYQQRCRKREMKYICAVCGREFEKDKGNHKYCSDECRAKGSRAIRKRWESDTGYTERQRLAIAKRRADAKPTAKRQQRKLREARVPVVKDGIAEQLLAARLKGDHLEYWQLFQKYEINNAEQQGYFSKCKVNGISVYHPQFVDLVLDSINREQRIQITH